MASTAPLAPAIAGVVAASDPGSTRLVYAMVAGLALVGVGFVVLGIWLIRRTRVDPPVLAPLERMGERGWKRRDPTTQRRMLDDVRPAGAVPRDQRPLPPVLLAEFDQLPPPASLTDLGPGVPADGAGDAAVETEPPPVDEVPESHDAEAVDDEAVDAETIDAGTVDAEAVDAETADEEIVDADPAEVADDEDEPAR